MPGGAKLIYLQPSVTASTSCENSQLFQVQHNGFTNGNMIIIGCESCTNGTCFFLIYPARSVFSLCFLYCFYHIELITFSWHFKNWRLGIKRTADVYHRFACLLF